VKPTDQEISDKRDEAASAARKPPKYPSMTYAEGVRDALEWVMGDLEDELEP
jgi:hypothetical protein